MLFNDEIIEIEELDERDTIDIMVDGNHLFYANDILVHNSWAIPATADWLGAIIQSPEQFEEGKYLLKNLKTRFGENLHEVWGLKVQRKRMLLEDDLDAVEAIPVSVRDTMERLDEKRSLSSNETDIFVFDEELG